MGDDGWGGGGGGGVTIKGAMVASKWLHHAVEVDIHTRVKPELCRKGRHAVMVSPVLRGLAESAVSPPRDPLAEPTRASLKEKLL